MSSKGKLRVSDSRLWFSSALGGEYGTSIVVENVQDAKVAFKVRTTSPGRYSVVPCKGFIDAEQAIPIHITLRLRDETHVNRGVHCLDKFLIQSVKVDDAVEQFPASLFAPAQGVDMSEVLVEAWLMEHSPENTLDHGCPFSARSSFAGLDVSHPRSNPSLFHEGALQSPPVPLAHMEVPCSFQIEALMQLQRKIAQLEFHVAHLEESCLTPAAKRYAFERHKLVLESSPTEKKIWTQRFQGKDPQCASSSSMVLDS